MLPNISQDSSILNADASASQLAAAQYANAKSVQLPILPAIIERLNMLNDIASSLRVSLGTNLDRIVGAVPVAEPEADGKCIRNGSHISLIVEQIDTMERNIRALADDAARLNTL